MTAKLLFILYTWSGKYYKFSIGFRKICNLFSWKKKLAVDLFHFFQSRNTIGRFMKTFLHRPIEILLFLPAGDFRHFWHNLKIFLCFQKHTTCKLSHAYIARDFVTCYSCFYYNSMILPIRISYLRANFIPPEEKCSPFY